MCSKLNLQIYDCKIRKCYSPFNQPTIWCKSCWKILLWSLNMIVCTKNLVKVTISLEECRIFTFNFRVALCSVIGHDKKNVSNLFGVGKKCSEFESSFAPWLTRPQPLLQSFDWLFLLLSIVSFLSGRPANVCTVVKLMFSFGQLVG